MVFKKLKPNREGNFSPGRVATDPPWEEVLARLRRIESRLVQLMKHEGMTSDGRHTLPEGKHTTD